MQVMADCIHHFNLIGAGFLQCFLNFIRHHMRAAIRGDVHNQNLLDLVLFHFRQGAVAVLHLLNAFCNNRAVARTNNVNIQVFDFIETFQHKLLKLSLIHIYASFFSIL